MASVRALSRASRIDRQASDSWAVSQSRARRFGSSGIGLGLVWSLNSSIRFEATTVSTIASASPAAAPPAAIQAAGLIQAGGPAGRFGPPAAAVAVVLLAAAVVVEGTASTEAAVGTDDGAGVGRGAGRGATASGASATATVSCSPPAIVNDR